MSRFRDGMVWAFLLLLALNLIFAAADAIKTAQISRAVAWLRDRVVVSETKDTSSEADRKQINETLRRLDERSDWLDKTVKDLQAADRKRQEARRKGQP